MQFLRDPRSGRLGPLRLLLALLAFVGIHAALARTSFSRAPHTVQGASWAQRSPAPSHPVVKTAHSPLRSGRRAGPRVGPSDASRAALPDAPMVIQAAGRPAAPLAPPSFVPPPPFHPPRGR